MIEQRHARLRAEMDVLGLDTFLSLKLVNTYYLSGFTSLDTVRPTTYVRPIVVVLDPAGACLVVPALDEEAAARASSIHEIWSYSTSPAADAARKAVVERLRASGARRIGVEQDAITAEWLAFLHERLPLVEVVFARAAVERLRLRKDDDELAAIRTAAALADEAVTASLSASAARVTELDAETGGLIALRTRAAEYGEMSIVDCIPIVLGGPHSSMPHEFTSGRPLREDDIMWHCWLVGYRGYWAENIRSGVVGSGRGAFVEAFDLLHESLYAGQDAARAGAVAGDVFRHVAAVLDRRRTGIVLSRTGHGVGLEYHEPPFLEDADETVLEHGMTITIEPGLWFPGEGGLTLSNTIVIRDGDPEVLTQSPLELHRTATAVPA